MGRMLAVGLGADAMMDHLSTARRAGGSVCEVSVAAINSPFAVTVAGDGDALAGIARQLDDAEVFHRFLPVEVPYHTHYMDLCQGRALRRVRRALVRAGDGPAVLHGHR